MHIDAVHTRQSEIGVFRIEAINRSFECVTATATRDTRQRGGGEGVEARGRACGPEGAVRGRVMMGRGVNAYPSINVCIDC